MGDQKGARRFNCITELSRNQDCLVWLRTAQLKQLFHFQLFVLCFCKIQVWSKDTKVGGKTFLN